MTDLNNNLIPDKWDKILAVAAAVLLGLCTMAIEGTWFGAGTVWIQRLQAVTGMFCAVFSIGVIARPAKVPK
jgi:hypothetical protein